MRRAQAGNSCCLKPEKKNNSQRSLICALCKLTHFFLLISQIFRQCISFLSCSLFIGALLNRHVTYLDLCFLFFRHAMVSSNSARVATRHPSRPWQTCRKNRRRKHGKEGSQVNRVQVTNPMSFRVLESFFSEEHGQNC